MLDHLIPIPVVFYFRLHFEPVSCIIDQSFTEISGLDVEIETETIIEGGENTSSHRVPSKIKHSNLVCKRVLVPLTCSMLSLWMEATISSYIKVVPYDVLVYLMNGNGVPVVSWGLTGVYPVKWSYGALDARKNEVAIETMEFAYSTIRRLL